MVAIKLSVEIPADRKLVITLPPDTPLGTAELTIIPHGSKYPLDLVDLAREAARAKRVH